MSSTAEETFKKVTVLLFIHSLSSFLLLVYKISRIPREEKPENKITHQHLSKKVTPYIF
jgi:hypothetical protein